MLLPVRRALLSVSDKTGLVELARALSERNIEILSTGGTAKLLAANGIPVREVSSYTGFPEIMDGRVKTLHPKIHGGLLGRRGIDEAVMASHDIQPIDLLVVNLYPFAETLPERTVLTRTQWKTSTSAAPPCCVQRRRITNRSRSPSIRPTTRCCCTS